MNCLELTTEQREKLKTIQLELLDEFKRFCCLHKLRFYLFGGTLLGAVRHQGFIPWDDDIDVCMPREDYDRFCDLYKETNQYFLQTTKTDKKYFYHFAKLTKKGTIYSEYFTQNIKTRKNIFIDIFPINGYPSLNKKLSLFHYKFWLFVLNKKSYPFNLSKPHKSKKSFSYVIMTIISWILLWWCPYHLSAAFRNSFMKRHQYSESKFCIVGTNLRKIYEKEYFTGFSEISFEGRVMFAMNDYSKYLTKMYGDYFKLPPEEEQIPHHYLVEFKS